MLRAKSSMTSIVPGADSLMVIGYFNVHVENDSDTWKDVIRRNGNRDFNPHGRLLLDFYSSGSLSIMNTFFQHKDIHKYTWHKLQR